jgi:hypothetical protein
MITLDYSCASSRRLSRICLSPVTSGSPIFVPSGWAPDGAGYTLEAWQADRGGSWLSTLTCLMSACDNTMRLLHLALLGGFAALRAKNRSSERHGSSVQTILAGAKLLTGYRVPLKSSAYQQRQCTQCAGSLSSGEPDVGFVEYCSVPERRYKYP